MSRIVEEWIGKTADSAIPARVRARVFEAHGGRCHISGRKIGAGEPWDCDHVIALINGGENREKTAQDVATKSKTARMRAKHLGIWPKSQTRWPSRKLGTGRTHREAQDHG